MGGRSRPRASHHHPAHHHPTAKPDDPPDTHEESLFWSKIVGELKSLHSLSIKVDNLEAKIRQEDARITSEEDPETSAQDLLRLASQYEDLLELVEVLEKNLATAYEDTQVLIGLRTATEGGDRAADTKRKKRKLDDTTDSPTPTYSRSKIARSASAAPSAPPSTASASGASSTAYPSATNLDEPLRRHHPPHKKHHPPAPSTPLPSTPSNTPSATAPASPLQLHSQVAYRLPPRTAKTSEGEYIQCIIIDISEVNGKKRYTIQDPEPDESRGHAQVYKAPASALIPIPKDSTGLPAYPVGKQVLAMYPETTMFYRAEVMGTKRDGTCRLKFEGEEEVGKETEVERRLVLDVSGR